MTQNHASGLIFLSLTLLLTGCGRAPDPIIRTEIVEVPVIQPVELDASWISPLERTHLIIQAKPVTGDLLNGYLECSAIVERADADRAAIRAVEGRNDG